ncbi:TrkA family potassium uptake protein [Photobacterium profundum]|uniref:Potassium uptake protein KtrA n=1 Tax=Photobacterium profundum 3TCK TaxID=314280 RepID=Q1YYS6_9GAMM|nr:TrkA family potassium uptake protein [Photobacterium profundum]EAS41482.1 potassium uptake protein KtrA [Photobacterium profundum 3TCK]PSV57860.1 TrkA family potassium uptake protein [Photobacterium profundum]
MGPEQKQFAIIGLGRFGMALCEELSQEGAQVLAVDINETNVKKVADIATQAVVADCSNEETISELKLDDYDLVMVSIGEDVNASILTTLVLKEAGVKSVWVKAKDRYHAKILTKIGADKIIRPERDMGIRIARNMLDKRIFEFADLGSGIALAEVLISCKHLGSKLKNHPCYIKPETTLLALKRGPEIRKDPSPDTELETGDLLIITGPKGKLTDILRHL